MAITPASLWVCSADVGLCGQRWGAGAGGSLTSPLPPAPGWGTALYGPAGVRLPKTKVPAWCAGGGSVVLSTGLQALGFVRSRLLWEHWAVAPGFLEAMEDCWLSGAESRQQSSGLEFETCRRLF